MVDQRIPATPGLTTTDNENSRELVLVQQRPSSSVSLWWWSCLKNPCTVVQDNSIWNTPPPPPEQPQSSFALKLLPHPHQSREQREPSPAAMPGEKDGFEEGSVVEVVSCLSSDSAASAVQITSHSSTLATLVEDVGVEINKPGDDSPTLSPASRSTPEGKITSHSSTFTTVMEDSGVEMRKERSDSPTVLATFPGLPARSTEEEILFEDVLSEDESAMVTNGNGNRSARLEVSMGGAFSTSRGRSIFDDDSHDQSHGLAGLGRSRDQDEEILFEEDDDLYFFEDQDDDYEGDKEHSYTHLRELERAEEVAAALTATTSTLSADEKEPLNSKHPFHAPEEEEEEEEEETRGCESEEKEISHNNGVPGGTDPGGADPVFMSTSTPTKNESTSVSESDVTSPSSEDDDEEGAGVDDRIAYPTHLVDEVQVEPGHEEKDGERWKRNQSRSPNEEAAAGAQEGLTKKLALRIAKGSLEKLSSTEAPAVSEESDDESLDNKWMDLESKWLRVAPSMSLDATTVNLLNAARGRATISVDTKAKARHVATEKEMETKLPSESAAEENTPKEAVADVKGTVSAEYSDEAPLLVQEAVAPEFEIAQLPPQAPKKQMSAEENGLTERITAENAATNALNLHTSSLNQHSPLEPNDLVEAEGRTDAIVVAEGDATLDITSPQKISDSQEQIDPIYVTDVVAVVTPSSVASTPLHTATDMATPMNGVATLANVGPLAELGTTPLVVETPSHINIVSPVNGDNQGDGRLSSETDGAMNLSTNLTDATTTTPVNQIDKLADTNSDLPEENCECLDSESQVETRKDASTTDTKEALTYETPVSSCASRLDSGTPTEKMLLEESLVHDLSPRSVCTELEESASLDVMERDDKVQLEPKALDFLPSSSESQETQVSRVQRTATLETKQHDPASGTTPVSAANLIGKSDGSPSTRDRQEMASYHTHSNVTIRKPTEQLKDEDEVDRNSRSSSPAVGILSEPSRSHTYRSEVLSKLLATRASQRVIAVKTASEEDNGKLAEKWLELESRWLGFSPKTTQLNVFDTSLGNDKERDVEYQNAEKTSLEPSSGLGHNSSSGTMSKSDAVQSKEELASEMRPGNVMSKQDPPGTAASRLQANKHLAQKWQTLNDEWQKFTPKATAFSGYPSGAGGRELVDNKQTGPPDNRLNGLYHKASHQAAAISTHRKKGACAVGRESKVATEECTKARSMNEKERTDRLVRAARSQAMKNGYRLSRTTGDEDLSRNIGNVHSSSRKIASPSNEIASPRKNRNPSKQLTSPRKNGNRSNGVPSPRKGGNPSKRCSSPRKSGNPSNAIASPRRSGNPSNGNTSLRKNGNATTRDGVSLPATGCSPSGYTSSKKKSNLTKTGIPNYGHERGRSPLPSTTIGARNSYERSRIVSSSPSKCRTLYRRNFPDEQDRTDTRPRVRSLGRRKRPVGDSNGPVVSGSQPNSCRRQVQALPKTRLCHSERPSRLPQLRGGSLTKGNTGRLS